MNEDICVLHGKPIYHSVSGWRHIAAADGQLCEPSKIGSGYMRRNLNWVGKGILDDGTPTWEYQKWSYALQFSTLPTSPDHAKQLIKALNNKGKSEGWQYALLRCSTCGCYHNQSSWVGVECDSCNKQVETMMAFNEGKKDNGLKKMLGLGPTLVRKEGDIWKLPKSTSPMWTEQWGYQGSSKVPYIVSHNSQKIDGSTTSDGWACSCPNFTRHTPRTPCKHILNVQIKEGLATVPKAAAKLANVDAEKLKAFEAWEREQAAAKKQGPASRSKLNLFGETGRKFR